MKTCLKRRRFLEALGVGAATLPFYRMLESSAVHAGGDVRPLRVLLLYSGDGGDWTYLRPKASAGPTGIALTPEMLTFDNSVLEPLAPYASSMTILEGIGMSAGLIANDPANPIASRTLYVGHEGSPANCYTGSPIVTIDGVIMPQSESLEYRLGQAAGATYVPHLAVGIGTSVGDFPSNSLSFNEQGQPLPGARNPADAFQLLFGNVDPGRMPDNAAAEKKLAEDRRVVDALSARAQSLRARLAGPERAKLDEHLEALATLEAQLDNAAIPVDCGTPTQPTGEGDPAADMLLATELHFEVLRQAFACDRTRFVLAGWGVDHAGAWLFGPELDDLHNNIAHMIEGEDVAATEAAKLNMAVLQRWHAERLKTFMDDLAATQDGAGSLLDNTLIVWATDFGRHTHGGLNVPYVLLGGAQGKLAMGRYFNHYQGEITDDWGTSGDWTKYQPNNKLLVSILNACGVAADTFGTTEFSGPLPGLNV
jgi:hypothetical protein